MKLEEDLILASPEYSIQNLKAFYALAAAESISDNTMHYKLAALELLVAKGLIITEKTQDVRNIELTGVAKKTRAYFR